MKLTESLTLNQQQLIIDGVLELACRAGIIKTRSLVCNGQQVLMLLDDMADMLSKERPIKYFTEGVIMPQGSAWLTMQDEVDERTGKPRQVKTARVISDATQTSVTEFDTLNTVYRAVPGLIIRDLRVPQPEED